MPLPNLVFAHLIFSGAIELNRVLRQLLGELGYAFPTLAPTESDRLADYAAGTPGPWYYRTHDDPSALAPLLADGQVRAVYIHRDLRDVAVAFARHYLARGGAPAGYDLRRTLEMVVSYNLLGDAEKAIAWMRPRSGVLHLSFADLEHDFCGTVRRITEHCGIDVDDGQIAAAVAAAGLTPREPGTGNAYVSIDGISGQYREHFDDSIASLFGIFLREAQISLGYDKGEPPQFGRLHNLPYSFFKRTRNPYYIYAPDYRQSSAGIRSLHYLCHALNELGYEAYVAKAETLNPSLRTPKLSQEVIEHHYLGGVTPIAIYPEVVSGNPLDLPVVIRWLLNKPGHLAGDTEYAPGNLVYYYNASFLPEHMRGEQLSLPSIDLDTFHNRDNPHHAKRSGACYFANKYLAFGGQVSPDLTNGATSLCLDIPRSAQEIADILRRAEVLYCYEQSSIVLEALACGCPVLIVPSDYWHDHGNSDGVGIGIRLSTQPNALAEAQAELDGYGEILRQGLRHSWWQVERMATQTQQTTAERASNLAAQSGASSTSGKGASWNIATEHRHRFLDDFRRSISLPASGPSRPTPQVADEQQAPTSTAQAVSFSLTAADLQLFDRRARQWEKAPLFHLVIVDDTGDSGAASSTLTNLLEQAYLNTIVTIASRQVAPGEIGSGRLEWWTTAEDPWLLVNEALANSPADWCGVIRVGDRIAPHALLTIAEHIHSHPQCRVIYTDEATTDGSQNFSQPRLKPDFDPYLMRASGYMGGLLLARKELWHQAGGWRALPRGVDELDAALRLSSSCKSEEVSRVAGILYFRSGSDPSLAAASDQTLIARLAVVQEHLSRTNVTADVEPGLVPGLVHVRYPLTEIPRVSLVIPTKDNFEHLERCITSIVENTDYPDYEILIVDNGSTESNTRAYLDGLAQIDPDRIRILPTSIPFCLIALLNHAATMALGEYLLFLHDDIQIPHRDWLRNMVTLGSQPGIAVVGARLVRGDGSTIEEAGLVPMQAGIVPNPFHGWPLEHPAPFGRLHAIQQVSAVSFACMLIKREVYLGVAGMDAGSLLPRPADIDLCLAVRKAGYRILWTPYATLIHESDGTMQGDKEDNNALLAKWGKAFVQDPSFNPYLAVGGEDFKVETEPAFLPDIITWRPVPNIYGMSSDFDGAGHYRVIQPLQESTSSGLIRGRLGRGYPIPAIMEKLDIDVIFSQRQLGDQQLKNLARFRKILGARIVMDFDDLLTKVPDKNIHKKDLLKDMKARLRQVGEISHRFTVSTEPLAEEFRQFHDDIRVIPNALMRSQWAHLKSERRTGKKLRVGWAGGVSHLGDLELIRDVVRETAKEVDWVFMGMCLTELKPYITEFDEGVKFNTYPEKLASLNLDLAIAPLEINHFNECKSHLRVLEYGILGIPVIATDIYPYRSGFPVTLVKNKHRDWMKVVRDHINNPDDLARRGDALRQYIFDRWMLDQHLASWQAAWAE